MQLINDTLAALSISAPQSFSNLAVYPLIAPAPRRTGRNPKTGERVPVPVPVPEKSVPHFKAAKELRERVDS